MPPGQIFALNDNLILLAYWLKKGHQKDWAI